MKKQIITIVVLLVLAGLAYAVINVKPAAENPDTSTSVDREVRGAVVSVNTDQVPVDGPALVTLRQQDGTEAVVAVMSMGINLCPAQPNITDISKLKAGDSVEARGTAGANEVIIPCESAEHYLRVATQ